MGLVCRHKLDPVVLFDLGEAVLELTRRGMPPPERQPGMSDEEFRVVCVKVNLHLRLCTFHASRKMQQC